MTTAPCALIKLSQGHGSLDSGFICRSWLLLGPPPPSWALSAKLTQAKAVFLSTQAELHADIPVPAQLPRPFSHS